MNSGTTGRALQIRESCTAAPNELNAAGQELKTKRVRTLCGLRTRKMRDLPPSVENNGIGGELQANM